jgi:hypothetical protein
MKKLSLTSVVGALAIMLVLSVMFWAGCGKEGGRATSPAVPVLPEVIPESATLDPAAVDESLAEEAPTPDGLGPVQACGTFTDGRSYALYTNPWPYVWTWKSHASCIAAMNSSTGVGRAYAYPIPRTVTQAKCRVRNSAIDRAWQYTGSNRTGRVVLLSPSRIRGTMQNYGGATASVWVTVNEYLPNGQYRGFYQGQVYSMTCTGSFDRNLNGLYYSFPLKTGYLYATEVWVSAYASSGSTPAQGSFCDINPADLKAFAVGFD